MQPAAHVVLRMALSTVSGLALLALPGSARAIPVHVEMFTTASALTTEFGTGSVAIDLGVYEAGGNYLLPSSGLSLEISGLSEPTANGTYDLLANNGGLTLSVSETTALLLGPVDAHLAFEHLTFGANLYASFLGTAGSGALSWGDAPSGEGRGSAHEFFFVLTAVPEPTTGLLFALGLLWLSGRKRWAH